MLQPPTGRFPMDQGGLVATCVVAILCLWLVFAVPLTGFGEGEVQPPHELATRLAEDPDYLARVTAEYLHTSWRDTEGTVMTVTGLPALITAAQAPGARGRAARAALDNARTALDLLESREPDAAADVRRAARGLGAPGSSLD